MTRYLHSVLALMLCLLLVLTGHSAGMVRGASAATDKMVICVGASTTVVYTDADGQPTAAPHVCPECLVSWLMPRHQNCNGTEGVISEALWQKPVVAKALPLWAVWGFDARGPPVVS